jgi:hypothetical protein
MNSSKRREQTKHRQANGFSTHITAILLILLFAMTFFFPILFGYTYTTVAGHHSAVYPWRAFDPQYHDYPQSDQADLNHPWQAFTKEAFRKGAFPFWNPYSFAGEPFFANGSSAVLYLPQTLAVLFLPLDWAHDILSLFHVLASGLFMYLLLREFEIGFGGALLAAAAWMLSSFNLAWLHLEVVAPISMFLPLSVWLVARAVRRSSWTSTLIAASVLAEALVSGHLLFCGLVYGIAVAYAMCLTVNSYRSNPAPTIPMQQFRHKQAALLRLAVIVLGPAALSAVVLWPTILALRALGRGTISYQAFHESIRVPYGLFVSLLKAPPLPVSESTMHRMLFVGTLTAIFALIGVFRRTRGTMFARILLLIVFLVATDTILLRFAYAILPQFSFFAPLGRLLNLFCFGTAILGGVGLDTVVRKISNRRLAQGLIAVVISFTVLQLAIYGRMINPPFVPRKAQNLYPETPVIRSLKQARSARGSYPGRILPLRQSQRSGWTPPILYANEAMPFSIESIGGYDSTLPERSETLLRIVSGQDPQTVLNMKYRRAYSPSFEMDRLRYYLLPRIGVTMLVTPPGIENDSQWVSEIYSPLRLEWRYSGPDGGIFSIKNVSGGPWVVHQAIYAKNAEAALEKFLDVSFNAARSVVLESPSMNGSPLSEASQPAASGTALVRENDINLMNILVTSPCAGWLVVPNSWDAGWQASVNGRETEVLRGNYAFQSVAISPGTSEVKLRYRPRGLLAGAALSGLAIAAAAAGLFICIKRGL